MATLTLALGAFAAEPTKSFDVPAGDAIATLKQAAQQGGVEIMFPAATVQGVRTAAVKGELTPRAALEQMLKDTGLVAVQDGKTGALAVKRDERPNALRAAQTESDRPTSQSKVEGGKLVLDKVEVTGTRIRGLLGEADFSPVTSFSRQDIERVGMTSIGELSRLIPQAYSQGSYDGIGFGGQSGGRSNTSDGSVAGATTTTRSTINLRGLGTASTLVLVDGRRLPTTGVIRGADANDLSGIPVSSIERIDVLTDGASAIYGSDAVGGVVNIILRKHYTGTEINLSYENTFDSDTAVRTATLTHSINQGKLSLMLSATWQDRHAFAAVDRYFTATDDWTTLGGTSLPTSLAGGGFSPTAGIVSVASGTLPGVGSQFAIMPNGATPTNLTLASFTPTTTSPTAGDKAPYVNIIAPQTTRSASFRLGYQLTPTLAFFADGRYSDRVTHIEGLPVTFLTRLAVPANYPGNPFGVAVRLNKTFWELGPIQGQKDALSSNAALSTGVRGILPHGWRFEAGLDLSRSILRDKNAYGPSLNTAAFNAAIAAQSLVLFYDSRTSQPNSTALLLSLFNDRSTRDKELSANWSASADGPVWELPAGPLRLAVGGEYRTDWSITRQGTPESPDINQSTLGDFQDTVGSVYAETRVPVIAPKHHIPLVNRFDLSSAVRYDENPGFGGHFSPSFGAQWRPISWLLVRGTRNNAFLAPTLQATARPRTDSTLFALPSFGFFDPARGGEFLNGVYPIVLGGNPNLKPQTSVSTNVGLVLQAPLKLLQGFSASVDFVDINYTDQISGASADTQTLLSFFPGRLTRGPNLPGDPAGVPGPIIALDVRPVNIAFVRIKSSDYQLNYHRSTVLGDFDVRGAATVYRQYLSKATPTAEIVDTLEQYPIRYTWQTYWNKGRYGAGVSGFYQRSFYPFAGVTSLFFRSAIEWNLQLAYDFGWKADKAEAETASRSWDKRLLANTKLSLTVFNVLDREPPKPRVGNGGFTVTDPRMARYALTLRKTF